jgi:hypothetical protein
VTPYVTPCDGQCDGSDLKNHQCFQGLSRCDGSSPRSSPPMSRPLRPWREILHLFQMFEFVSCPPKSRSERDEGWTDLGFRASDFSPLRLLQPNQAQSNPIKPNQTKNPPPPSPTRNTEHGIRNTSPNLSEPIRTYPDLSEPFCCSIFCVPPNNPPIHESTNPYGRPASNGPARLSHAVARDRRFAHPQRARITWAGQVVGFLPA